ncbi:hypothetical protein ACS0TY_003591 [Phlomoides rotata]
MWGTSSSKSCKVITNYLAPTGKGPLGYPNGYPMELMSSNIQMALRTNTHGMLTTLRSTTNRYSSF